MKFDIDCLRLALARHVAAPPDSEEAAAVAAVLRQSEGGVQALLIRRASHEHDPWSGQMAFPGGRRHAADSSLLETAVRETKEEVGLDLQEHAALLGALEPLPAMAGGQSTGFSITPFVFLWQGPYQPTLDPNEVAEALWAPLDPMCRGENRCTHIYTRGGARYELPAFDVNGRVVWGLTHRMLVNLLQLPGARR